MSEPQLHHVGGGGITFELYEYNPRRRQRGVEAARVKTTEDGEEYLLWMSPADILKNLKAHGESKGLRDALEAYRINAMPSNTEPMSTARPANS